jgi:ADP-ribosylarginine hydrolase
MKSNLKSKYIAAFLLHALGDTLGFKNGEWEFNYFQESITLNMSTEILYDFISLGGINGINLKDWFVSDDTIINLAVAKGLLMSEKFNEAMIHNIEQEMIIAFNDMITDKENNKDRYFGVTTYKYIKLINKGKDGRTLPYDKNSGGNGAAMRAGPIGLVFYDNQDLLIKASIDIGRLTHNSSFGYLAALTVSLFTSYALKDIDIYKWPFMLIDLLNSDDVKKYVNDDQDEQNDYEKYINYWVKYVDTRFENGKPLSYKSHKNLIFRSRYYYENFTKDTLSLLIGESGFCAVIMAYDSLVDCDGFWEKLVIYSALHLGDGDTVGAIAGFLYGVLYGFGDVPEGNLKNLEFKDELTKIGEQFYEKYHNK